MFVDKAVISIKAGRGGDGCVSFRREKYVAAGGPDGGDGGRGGDVIFVADTNKTSLVEFKYKKRYAAGDGNPGSKKKCSGRRGSDLVIKVPPGTLVRDNATRRLLADLSDGCPVAIAKGGRGGRGNQHFATPTRQIPRFAKPGRPGEAYELELELKLLADVGFAGFPNVGKSTLLSVISDAKPLIANYPFTTLTPVLGVVRVDSETSFVAADIPGLIEGASQGVGLGHEFLRHIDRCRLIVHIIDVSASEGRDPLEDYHTIRRELERFSPALAGRPTLIAANKCDIATDEQRELFAKQMGLLGFEVFEISAATSMGVENLVKAISKELSLLPPVVRYQPEELPAEKGTGESGRFEAYKRGDVFHVEAEWLDMVLGSVNPNDYESLSYLHRVLRQSGIIGELEKMGVCQGDTVCLNDFAFDYIE
jgi:GTP-binding protein